MKITGLILTAIALCGAIVCLIPLIQTGATHQEMPAAANDDSSRPISLIVPLMVCGVVGTVGIFMVVYGGKGYFISNDPRVRN